MIQVGNVIVSSLCLTEFFACDLARCKGQCCIEGDAGAPLTTEEALELEDALPAFEDCLTPEARSLIQKQGVAYVDSEGDLVTSIVGGKDCAFSFTDKEGCLLCAAEKAFREGHTHFCKPLSCALYPIRVTPLTGGGCALNYHQWDICSTARERGRKENIRVWQFLKGPLCRAFGDAWYEELTETVLALKKEGLL